VLERGFIGPIGDDLPSLIPLLFGLVMFFSTFTLTFNTFDDRNVQFDDDISIMRISRTLQSNSYIFSHKNFELLCSEIGIVNLDFVAGITEQGTRGEDGVVVGSIFEVEFFKNSEGEFMCTNVPLDEATLTDPARVENFLPLEVAVDRKVVSRIFPIVVEDNKVVKPMHLVVIAWK